MKIQPIDPKPAARVKTNPPALSNEAFYLIAIAILLRKEKGNASMLHYVVPGLPEKKKSKLHN